MKRLLCYALLCCLPPTATSLAQESAAPAAGSKESFRAAGENLLTKLEEFATILDTAKTKATAETAKPKLAKLNKEIETVSQAAAAMGDPPPEIKEALDNDPKMQERAQAFMNKLITASQRIANDKELLAILQQTMRDFQRVSQPPARPTKPTTPPAKKNP